MQEAMMRENHFYSPALLFIYFFSSFLEMPCFNSVRFLNSKSCVFNFLYFVPPFLALLRNLKKARLRLRMRKVMSFEEVMFSFAFLDLVGRTGTKNSQFLDFSDML